MPVSVFITTWLECARGIVAWLSQLGAPPRFPPLGREEIDDVGMFDENFLTDLSTRRWCSTGIVGGALKKKKKSVVTPWAIWPLNKTFRGRDKNGRKKQKKKNIFFFFSFFFFFSSLPASFGQQVVQHRCAAQLSLSLSPLSSFFLLLYQ